MQNDGLKTDIAADRAGISARVKLALRARLRRILAAFKVRGDPAGHSSPPRRYPELPVGTAQATLPISFVVVRFSDEYLHNFLKSECAHHPLNEVIVVDNTSNLYFDNLSQAILAGLGRAHNDIIVVVHEDVLLPAGWQPHFEQSLRQLEDHDPSWGVLGSVGWNAAGQFVGHWSDPHQFKNTFNDSPYKFHEVQKLDEQLLIFHRRRMPQLDSSLPGIHFLGEDLKQELARVGMACYAVDAPTIHKYADRHGERIVSSTQSDKISDRESATYLADEACCKDYLGRKYPHVFPVADSNLGAVKLSPKRELQAACPIIFICKGEQEAVLARQFAQAFGIVVGDVSGETGEASLLRVPIYKMIIEKYRCHAHWQKHHTADTLQHVAARLLGDLPLDACWGIFVPESILVLPELRSVFPDARYVYIQRDPFSSCREQPHRTACLNNHLGRIALPEAYGALGLQRSLILEGDQLDHMVCTTIHQLELVRQHLASVAEGELLVLPFEECIDSPASAIECFSRWLGAAESEDASARRNLDATLARALSIETCEYSQAQELAAKTRLSAIRKSLGYI
jgi:hypothetical protein